MLTITSGKFSWSHAAIILLLCGTMTYTNISLANQSTIGSQRIEAVHAQNSHIESALSKIGNKDAGEAVVEYHRHNHVLLFTVTNYEFKDSIMKNLRRQIKYFQAHTGIAHINAEIQVTSKAIHSHNIQVNEQRKQRIENHIEAEQAIKRAQKEAKEKAERAIAKARTKAKMKRKQAQAKARAKAKAKRQAQQKKQQALKKAKKNAVNRKSKNSKKK